MENKNKLSKNILDKLNSKDEKNIINAINSISDSNNSNYLPYVFELFKNKPNSNIIKLISQLLNDSKNNDATIHVVDAIKNPLYKEYLYYLVSSCWISGLDYSKYHSIFIDVVLKEDYQLAFESLTVIENLLHNLSQNDVELCLDKLNSSIESIPTEKRGLVNELVKIIESY